MLPSLEEEKFCIRIYLDCFSKSHVIGQNSTDIVHIVSIEKSNPFSLIVSKILVNDGRNLSSALKQIYVKFVI